MSTTIREVAKAAGVSATTVSRVFNQRHLVNRATRMRILDAAERLQYVPNAAARSLTIRRRNVLGVIVPLPHSEFFIEMVRGMDRAAQRLGYMLLISGSHNRAEDARTAFRSMKGQVDGFLVVAPDGEQEAWLEALPADVFAIFLNTPAPHDHYGSIQLTNHTGAYEATRHLVELGHERVAIVTGPAVNNEARERLQGYRRALADAGLEAHPALQLAGDFSRESGVEAGRAVLALPHPPTAVFASNDLMAIGMLSVFHATGVRVPDDVALIGFDDIPMARYVQPTLSTVRIPIEEMGMRAVERLVGRIEDGAPAAADLLETRLIPRATTLGVVDREAEENVLLA